MARIRLLDCTLRDGAQANQACFGEEVISDIVYNLTRANVEIIECGFIKECEFDKDKTYFPQPSCIKKYLPQDKGSSKYAALMDIGGCGMLKQRHTDL